MVTRLRVTMVEAMENIEVLTAKSKVLGEHLAIQLLLATASLLVTLVSLVFLVEEFLLVRLRWSVRRRCWSHRADRRDYSKHLFLPPSLLRRLIFMAFAYFG